RMLGGLAPRRRRRARVDQSREPPCARTRARGRRRRHVSRRGEGCGDRPRRGACGCARTPCRAGCERRRRGRRRSGRRAARARAGEGGGVMSQRRHGDPLPLGDAELPYSKGLMARALIAVGVSADRAYMLARQAEVELAERRERTLDVARLEELARELLGEKEGERAVRRLRRLADLQALDIPLIVLIGGSTGTGKSTIAAEVAHRLGITRVTSTDFIRQTMR